MSKQVFKSKNIISVILIIAIMSISINTTVYAKTSKPQNITSTFGKEAKSEHNFTWVTNTGVEEGRIEYCERVEFKDFESENIIRVLANSYETKTNNDKRVIHKVELKNLKGNTDFVYRVGIDGNFSNKGFFSTSGKEPLGFTFINITDTQGDNSKHYDIWKNTLEKAVEKFPKAKFIVHTGDLVDNGSKIKQWDFFFGAVQNKLMNLPIAPAVGNHDILNKNSSNTDLKNFTDSFNLPEEQNIGAPSGTVYSFDYGNAHIAVMNTEVDREGLRIQGNWLKLDMAETTKRWKIVALHRGPYGATYNSVDVRNEWAPIFDETYVDLVLQGHDHNYIRSYPMEDFGRVGNGEGTLYMTSNSGGVKFYPPKNRDWQEVDLQPYKQMYIAVTIKNNKMLIQAFDIDDELLDSISLEKEKISTIFYNRINAFSNNLKRILNYFREIFKDLEFDNSNKTEKIVDN